MVFREFKGVDVS